MTDQVPLLGYEPDDLDGHTIEELTDYLERGGRPADPSIDDSAACRIALAALQRLQDLAGAYLDVEPGAPRSDEDWIGAVLAAIPIDAHAGRRFPWPSADPRIAAHTTEGALRGLVRAVGDDVPGLLVGSVRILTGRDGPAALQVEVALVYGTVLDDAVDALRLALRTALPRHAPFPVDAIDVRVVGLIEPSAAPEPEPR